MLSKRSGKARAIRKSVCGGPRWATPRSVSAIWTPPLRNTRAIHVGYRNRVVNMAGAYALQGKMDEAKSVLAEALRANPKLTVKMLTERFAIPPALTDGLRKAGLAEE